MYQGCLTQVSKFNNVVAYNSARFQWSFSDVNKDKAKIKASIRPSCSFADYVRVINDNIELNWMFKFQG